MTKIKTLNSNYQFSIVLNSPELHFNASHSLTFKGPDGSFVREPLHGHDFQVELTVSGPLDESGCVVDFVAATNLLRDILKDWNYKTIVSANCDRRNDAQSDDAYREVGANPSTEIIAAAILDEFTERILPSLSNPNSYSFELCLREAPGCFARVTFAPR